MATRFIRLPMVKDLTGHSRSAIYAHIANGTLPPPIKLGKRSSAWAEDEIQRINSARLAGRSDKEIKALVTSLVAQRKEANA